MRKKTPKLTALLLTLAFALGVASPALAAPATEHMTIKAPKNNAVIYRGDPIPLRVDTEELYVDFEYEITVKLINNKTKKTYWNMSCLGADCAETWDRNNLGDPPKTSKLPVGSYTLSAYMDANWQNYEDEYVPPEVTSFQETATTKFTIAALKAPTKVRATAGKRKVTVTWRKVAGATKYEVWRSAKKNSGFKRIKTTTALKFVNKKLKKGKRYYYRVRAVRTKYGKVNGPFSVKVRSKKVK